MASARQTSRRGNHGSATCSAATDHGRAPTSPRRRRIIRRAPRKVRPTVSVWPCLPPQGETDTADDWLERAVVKIVTTYTQPGQRVLIVSPPPPETTPPRWTTTARRWPPDPYQDLPETNWVIARLGRSAQTTLATHPHGDPSGPRRTVAAPRVRDARAGRRAVDEAPRPGGHDHTISGGDPAGPATGRGVGCFDLIVTAADPRDHTWFTRRDWRALLRPGGTLTVITHSDTSDGSLVDPHTSIEATLSDNQMVVLDHIVLAHHRPAEARDVLAARPGRVGWKPLRHPRGHHDLLVCIEGRREH